MKKTLVFAMLIAFMTVVSPISAQTVVKSKYVLDIRPEENIVLKPKTDYYVSIRVVDGFGEKGFLYLNAYMKNGLYRNAVKGKTKKLPVCPAILVKGYEME